MGTDQPIDELIRDVQTFEREQCVHHIRQFDHPHLDFSEEFLASQSLDRLRHILMAACLQARRNGACGSKSRA